MRIILSTLICILVSCGAPEPSAELVSELVGASCSVDADCGSPCQACELGVCVARPAGTACGEQRTGGPCDLPDRCDGVGACVTIKPAGTLCKLGNHPICDPDDYCDGKRVLCPGRIAPPGTPCGGGKVCVLVGVCR